MSSDKLRPSDTSLPADNKPRIVVRGVSKIYHLYDRPEDRLKQLFLGSRKKLFREHWALRDVSFEVQPGEAFGIVGRNGAGKSTLLQLLAGVLQPTTGSVQIRGRIAALLELGAGFQPEFSGRENVYINAAILGISREEVKRRYQEIIDFADIGEFIEQPVKTYSSGMIVRLAFAVTTCLEPDILLVDEALAVGDVFFQQKCYRRLDELRARGTSIVFVSHAMPEVAQFCQRALFLHRGQPVFIGSAPDAVKQYYQYDHEPRSTSVAMTSAQQAPKETKAASALPGDFWPEEHAFVSLDNAKATSDGSATCRGVAICDATGRPCGTFEQGQPMSIFCEFDIHRDLEVPIAGFVIANRKGVYVHGRNSLQTAAQNGSAVHPGDRVRTRMDVELSLECGEYTLELGFATVSRRMYQMRGEVSNVDLTNDIRHLCELTGVARFAVIMRRSFEPMQLMFHGMARLPGDINLAVVEANSSQVADEPCDQRTVSQAA